MALTDNWEHGYLSLHEISKFVEVWSTVIDVGWLEDDFCSEPQLNL